MLVLLTVPYPLPPSHLSLKSPFLAPLICQEANIASEARLAICHTCHQANGKEKSLTVMTEPGGGGQLATSGVSWQKAAACKVMMRA